MSIKAIAGADWKLGAVAVIGVLAVLWFAKKTATDTIKGAADIAGGIVSGNNAVTAGTVYEGWGLPGTLGAVTNDLTGGILENIGSWIGGGFYDLTHPQPIEKSGAIQSSSNKPFNAGPSSGYADAIAGPQDPMFTLGVPVI